MTALLAIVSQTSKTIIHSVSSRTSSRILDYKKFLWPHRKYDTAFIIKTNSSVSAHALQTSRYCLNYHTLSSAPENKRLCQL